jgi:hypothetical protein
MQTNHFQIYLNDHLALMVGELQLAERCFRSNSKDDLGRCLMTLIGDLRIERKVVEELVRQTGGRPDVIKQGTAWFAEKLGRLKMNGSWLEYSALSRLIELETLEVAAHERLAFWQNVELALESDAGKEVKATNFARYREESEKHCRELSEQRVEAARTAFASEQCESSEAVANCGVGTHGTG